MRSRKMKAISKFSSGKNNIALKQNKFNRAKKNAKPAYDEYFSGKRRTKAVKDNYNKKSRIAANAYSRVVRSK